MEGGTEEEVTRNRGRESWGGGGREPGNREGEDSRSVRVWFTGLKRSGPRIGLVEGPESRSGGVKTSEIGNKDFQSVEKSIVGIGGAAAEQGRPLEGFGGGSARSSRTPLDDQRSPQQEAVS